jgi:hypothetical protein
MPDTLFADTGPEGRNRDSAGFERQLRFLAGDLGWKVLDCNIDVYLADDEKDAAGIDIVVAMLNPQTRRDDGWLLEGKRHDGPGRYTTSLLTNEVQRLRKKVAGLSGRKRFTEHERIRPHIEQLVGGVLAHHCAADYERDRAVAALNDMTLHTFETGNDPLRICYLGPDTLNGLGEAFGQVVPAEFLWPATVRYDNEWSQSCPPEALAAGMIAYRTTPPGSKTVLWLRDTLEHGDIPALARICRLSALDVDVVMCTELSQENLARLRTAWEEMSAETREGTGPGMLPKDVRALEVSNANMKEFNKRWPDAVVA